MTFCVKCSIMKELVGCAPGMECMFEFMVIFGHFKISSMSLHFL